MSILSFWYLSDEDLPLVRPWHVQLFAVVNNKTSIMVKKKLQESIVFDSGPTVTHDMKKTGAKLSMPNE